MASLYGVIDFECGKLLLTDNAKCPSLCDSTDRKHGTHDILGG